MRGKILKKLTALFLALVLLSSVSGVYAIMSPGPAEYEFERSYILEMKDASLSGNDIVFKKNGTVFADLLMPFDSDKLVLGFDAVKSNVTLKIETDNNTYQASISQSAKTAEIPIQELFGSNTIRFTSNGELTLKSINFKKIDENFNEANGIIPPLTE